MILTTSNSESDRARCRALGATEYQVKPFRLDAYLALFRTFRRYLDDEGPREPDQPEGGNGGPAPTPISGPSPVTGSQDSPQGHFLACGIESVSAA